MLKWLKTLFGTKDRVVSIEDPDFGPISFFPCPSNDSLTGIWQMHDDWDAPDQFAKVGCSSIPGTREGPDTRARTFLLAKRAALSSVWTQCGDELEKARARWSRLPTGVPLTECFVLTSLSLEDSISDPPRWSAGFESKGAFWVYVDVQLVGDIAIGHSCDT